jgi:hypothetical protein
VRTSRRACRTVSSRIGVQACTELIVLDRWIARKGHALGTDLAACAPIGADGVELIELLSNPADELDA